MTANHKNPKSKVSASDIPADMLRELVAAGKSDRAIAPIIGCSWQTVMRARHLNGIRREQLPESTAVPDHVHAAWLKRIRARESRRPVWVPREANC